MSREIKKLEPNDSLEKKQGGEKWGSLIHNGVLFPPTYEPLPPSIKILYNKKPVVLDNKNTNNPLNISAEEAAVFMAMRMEQDDRLGEKDKKRKKVQDDKKFMDNFWKDWRKVLGENHTIKDIYQVDFTPIQKFLSSRSEQKKEAKKNMTKEEKKQEKKQKESIKELYGYALVDGRKIPLGNYQIQPPGIFIGHGEAPLRGKIKKRIKPSDITLNISKRYIPKCYDNKKGCKWGDTVENKDVEWVAFWKNPVNDKPNYVNLSRQESHFVHDSDKNKFEKARNLGRNIERVRTLYKKDLENENKLKKQLATAVYLLDELAIRPGTEKDESKEAGTQGLTTLKCDNIEFKTKNTILIKFIGKSSIEFTKTFLVLPVVYKNLKELCERSSKKKMFPGVDSNSLNGYLKTLLPGLTAKVFRTYKASSILQKELSKNIPSVDDEIHTKKLVYDKVNIEVAKALNHKKMGGSSDKVDKIKIKIEELEQKKIDASDKQKKTIQKSIDLAKSKLEEAEQNISTSTSKVNYMDPRIVVAWCKMVEMPIEKMYNKGSLKKFVWSMDTNSEWKF